MGPPSAPSYRRRDSGVCGSGPPSEAVDWGVGGGWGLQRPSAIFTVESAVGGRKSSVLHKKIGQTHLSSCGNQIMICS